MTCVQPTTWEAGFLPGELSSTQGSRETCSYVNDLLYRKGLLNVNFHIATSSALDNSESEGGMEIGEREFISPDHPV